MEIKKKRYLSLRFTNEITRLFPFSSITELEDFTSYLILNLNNGNKYEVRKNVDIVREMILEDWRLDGEIVDVDRVGDEKVCGLCKNFIQSNAIYGSPYFCPNCNQEWFLDKEKWWRKIG